MLTNHAEPAEYAESAENNAVGTFCELGDFCEFCVATNDGE
jgi:hypothetical protein